MKVYVATIAWRSLHPKHVFCLMTLLSRPGLLWGPVAGDALVERSRGRCATDFLLRSEADVLVSIDTDISFSPDDVLTIARQAHEAQAIVGGVYMARAKAHGQPTTVFEMDRRYDFALTDPDTVAPVPVRWVAGGFMAVPRSVFETLAKTLPLCDRDTALEQYPFYLPFAIEGEHGPSMLSEDFALCERARQAGFPIMVNTGVRLEHIGETEFRLEDMLSKHDTPEQPMAITRSRQGFTVEHE